MKKLLPLIVIVLTSLLLVACGETPPDPIPSTKYSLKTYSETDEYGAAGTYTEINSQYAPGNSVALEASVNPGYNFVGWFVNGACVSEDLEYTFTMGAGNTEIEARYNYFTVRTFSESDDSEKAGTYTTLKSKKISVGEEVKAEATVNAGYNFEGWFINDVCVSEELTYSFVMKEKNVDLEARWNYFTVSVDSYTDEEGTAGTFTKKDREKISVGETVILNATVNEGFNFEGWFINDVCVSEELTYPFVMKEKNVDLEARWNYFTVSVDSYTDEEGTAGTFTKKDREKISVGETVILNATVNEGYNFEGWYLNGIQVSSNLEYSFTMEDEDVELAAVFSSYTVTTFSNSSLEGTFGTYTQIDQRVSAGETVTLIAQAAQGCNFEGWYVWDGVNSACICEDAEYSFKMGKENVGIEARFSAYTLNTDAFLRTDKSYMDEIKPGINVDYFGSYSCVEYDPSMGDYTQYKNVYVAAGEEITLVATEKSGYTFLGWKRGLDLISTSHTYTFVMGKSDILYEAVYVTNE